MINKNTIPLFFTTTSFNHWRSTLTENLGFVPTMGNLHLGHIHLVEEALKLYETVVVSIFVNPTQFGPNEDFDKYPRTLDQDCEMLLRLWQKYPDKKIIIFAPKTPSEIYVDNSTTTISAGAISQTLEGKSRPGHFQGVCNIVAILLNIVTPSELFLGKKDYQQLKILSKMILDLKFRVKVHAVETVRLANGLAMSSRNNFLSPEELDFAKKFPMSLNELKYKLIEHWQIANCWKSATVTSLISTYCQNSSLNWDYCELRQQDLAPINEHSQQVVLLGVVKIQQVRLLDNLEFNL